MATKRPKRRKQPIKADEPAQAQTQPQRALSEAIRFGLMLNRCFFFSQQCWINLETSTLGRVTSAWVELGIQSRKLAGPPLVSDGLQSIVESVGREFAAILNSSWHRERRENLAEAISQLDDDEYFDDARDQHFLRFLRPVLDLRQQLLDSYSPQLDERQIRAILLGEHLDSLVRPKRMWRAMYARRREGQVICSQEASDPSPPKKFQPSDFDPVPDSSHTASPEEFLTSWVPMESVESSPCSITDFERREIQARVSEIGISWEVAKATLCLGVVPNSHDVLSDSVIQNFTDALLNATNDPANRQQEPYLGIRIEGTRLFNAAGKSVSFERAGKALNLAYHLKEAREAGMTRKQIAELNGSSSESAADRARSELNKRLAVVGLIAEFRGGTLRIEPM